MRSPEHAVPDPWPKTIAIASTLLVATFAAVTATTFARWNNEAPTVVVTTPPTLTTTTTTATTVPSSTMVDLVHSRIDRGWPDWAEAPRTEPECAPGGWQAGEKVRGHVLPEWWATMVCAQIAPERHAFFIAMPACESGFKVDARGRTSDSGVVQWIRTSWRDWTDLYGVDWPHSDAIDRPDRALELADYAIDVQGIPGPWFRSESCWSPLLRGASSSPPSTVPPLRTIPGEAVRVVPDVEAVSRKAGVWRRYCWLPDADVPLHGIEVTYEVCVAAGGSWGHR